MLKNKIKLVIWDLDETFWQGTLSEEGVTYSTQNHQRVIELAKRGIMSSICSKNTRASTQAFLEKKGIWEYFIFPQIGWHPKGPMLEVLIEAAQLQAKHVLFIDDNPMNLEEAKHFLPDIQTATPDIIPTLLDLPELMGKQDLQLERLHKYKTLERKHLARINTQLDNHTFLRQSDIQVAIMTPSPRDYARIHELIERTNQLNFTKVRLTYPQTLQLLEDKSQTNRCIYVQDRYGDYGLAGFYNIQGNKLEHFVFSCRILNMGVESWLYQHLGKPKLISNPPVSGDLSTDVDWITQIESPASIISTATPKHRASILIKGGCDLAQVANYLPHSSHIETEFNYISSDGISVHNDHTEIFLASTPPKTILAQYPFLTAADYASKMNADNYEVLIYSLLMDYSQGLYQSKSTGCIIPHGDFMLDITQEKNWPQLLPFKGYTESFLQWFQKEFTFLGPLSAQSLRQNLSTLVQRIAGRPLILINGAEVPSPFKKLEADRHHHHTALNQVVDEAVAAHDNLHLCDVRKIITSPSDLTDHIRHYKRECYYQMAQNIAGTLRDINQDYAISVSKIHFLIKRIKNKIKRTIANCIKTA